jgi:hypothetical protein
MDAMLHRLGRLLRDPNVQVDGFGFCVALVVSLLVAVIVSLLYQIFYENRATGAQIHRSFFLISPSVTALFIAIQHSLPLSLGLLGALSIIRFRTPIKEPEEIGFLMLLIASAVVCATFQFFLLAALLSSVTFALVCVRQFPRVMASKRHDGTVIVAFEGELPDATRDGVLTVLRDRLQRGRLRSMTFSGSVTTLHYSFTGAGSEGLHGLHTALAELTPVEKLNVFFSDQGSLP